MPTTPNSANYVSFSSSLADDVWHPKKSTVGYEWWYFDAISDDANEAIIITFLENHLYSKEYALAGTTRNHATNQDRPVGAPAVLFAYYKNGKPKFRILQEFGTGDFEAETEKPACSIGKNSFRFESAPYGSGFLINLSLPLRNGRTLSAEIEWLAIESNFDCEENLFEPGKHRWNLTIPRADVTGRIRVFNRNGKPHREINFRGTGYHDHNLDDRWLPETVTTWQRGRAHFPEATVIFYRYLETGKSRPETKLVLVDEEGMRLEDAVATESEVRRSLYGLKHPGIINFEAPEIESLNVRQNRLIDSTFFYLKFFSEFTLQLRDGKILSGIGTSEQLSPKLLKYGWVRILRHLRNRS
ncbi:MAG: hypothetical protein ACK5NT_06145 [Pyrinomonadaceae bacterium]